MLDLDRADRPLPRELLETNGGFAWWYADLFDEDGTGLVCIWSYGLPFLPGYMSSHRAGRGTQAMANPSLNLVVYDNGVPVAYTLLRLDPSRARWEGDTWAFGESRFSLSHAGGQRVLQAELDLPVPGSSARLTGSFTIRGPRIQSHESSADNPVHAWTPLMGPATSEVSLRVGTEPLIETVGSGYHDRNGCPHPMDELGLDHWIWTRQVIGNELLITYLNFPDDGAAPYHVAVRIDGSGTLQVQPLELELHQRKTATFGMPWWRRATLHGLDSPIEMTFSRPFDDSPFYLRTWVQTRCKGVQTRGIAELCRPHRIDRAWHRPLVNMVVQQEEGRESMWLPLFAGPSSNRLSRLFRHWGRP